MRILHVTPAYYPATMHGGPIGTMRALDQAFTSLGASVDVLTTNTHKSEDLDVETDTWVADGEVRVRYMPRIGRSTYSFCPRQLSFLISEGASYDYIYVTSLFTFAPVACALFSVMNRTPLWVSPRGLHLYRRPVLKAAHMQLFEKRLYRKARFVHVTSSEEALKLQSAGLGARYVLAPNGITEVSPSKPAAVWRFAASKARESVETDRFLASLARSRFFYFGTISRVKGSYDLVKAFCNTEQLSGSSLVLIGPDDREERDRILTDFKDQIGVSLEILDRLPAGEIIGLAPELGVSVHPAMHENFSNSLIEVSRLHLPAVVSAGIGALQFISKDGLITYDPSEDGGLGRALVHAKESYTSLKGEAVYRTVSLKTWSETAQTLVDAMNAYGSESA